MYNKTTLAIFATCFYVAGSLALAQNETKSMATHFLRAEEKRNTSEFELFIEVSQFDNAGIKLNGQGAGTSLKYSFNDDFTFSFSAAQAYGSGGNVSSLYTALRSHLQYNFYGLPKRKYQRIFFDDQIFAEVEQSDKLSLAVALGVSQYFFNGSTSVTPGTGFEAYLRSRFQLFKMSWSAAVGLPFIYINQTQVTGLLFTFGPNFEF